MVKEKDLDNWMAQSEEPPAEGEGSRGLSGACLCAVFSGNAREFKHDKVFFPSLPPPH